MGLVECDVWKCDSHSVNESLFGHVRRHMRFACHVRLSNNLLSR